MRGRRGMRASVAMDGGLAIEIKVGKQFEDGFAKKITLVNVGIHHASIPDDNIEVDRTRKVFVVGADASQSGFKMAEPATQVLAIEAGFEQESAVEKLRLAWRSDGGSDAKFRFSEKPDVAGPGNGPAGAGDVAPGLDIGADSDDGAVHGLRSALASTDTESA